MGTRSASLSHELPRPLGFKEPRAWTMERTRDRRGVVAALDILGTKGVGTVRDTKDFVVRWHRTLEGARAHAHKLGWVGLLAKVEDTRAGVRLHLSEENSKMLAFSDTLVLVAWAHRSPKDLLPAMGAVLQNVVADGIFNQVFLRGAVSFGRYTVTTDMVIGPAADDAYQNMERLPWIGVHLTDSASFAWEQELEGTSSGRNTQFVRHSVEAPGEEAETVWALDWPFRWSRGRDYLLECFAENPIPHRDAAKYRNALKLFDSTRPKHDAEILGR